jgi:phosphoribosylformimino-5-aminoimidazole carboxamide ribotide isomerase
MNLLPVIDLLDGVVVRGVQGQRDQYRPIESQLTAKSDVISVAHAFREHFGFSELYVADLDAILHESPHFEIYRDLKNEGFRILVDAGLRDVAMAREAFAAGSTAVIAGLETSNGPSQIAQLCSEFGPERVLFSLDMQAGNPLGFLDAWPSSDPFELGQEAIRAGIERMIVLDLQSVGASKGPITDSLCRQFLNKRPQLRLITGGGIRDVSDLPALAEIGVESVLVASALHDGRIAPDDVTQWPGESRVSSSRGSKTNG